MTERIAGVAKREFNQRKERDLNIDVLVMNRQYRDRDYERAMEKQIRKK